jgi:4-diphosphocytidyl-2-C-methyl-D-erythritol kinase
MTFRFASANDTDDAAAMVKLLAERAFAKINLFLRVTGRRADGYHELDSIFVPVSISDRITIEVRPAPTSSITLRCNIASLGDPQSNLASRPAPTSSITLRCNIASLGDPQSNLASRAARSFMSEFGISAHVMIDLEKTIPAGAGLGGGSSDAGTVLRMLTSMMAPMLSEFGDASGRIRRIALALGADVPFFLNPCPSRVTGIGELIEALDGFATLHLVIAVPPVEVPTTSVFKALKREGWSGPASAGDLDEILRGEISARHLVNDLEAPAMQLYPQIASLKALLEECGATASSMSGSGGSVFGLFVNEETASRGAESLRLKAPGARVFVAKSLEA